MTRTMEQKTADKKPAATETAPDWPDVEAPRDPEQLYRENRKEGRECPVIGPLLYHCYRIPSNHLRRFLRYMAIRLEKGPLYSVTIRRMFRRYHNIEVGMYTGQGCFFYRNFPAGTRVGRYTAIFKTVQSFNANHPMNLKSTHAFFFNPRQGFVKEDLVTRSHLTIGNDVWIGHNSVLLSTCTRIGDGAIIGAGSVVSQDVPPYAVVVGNPARVVRYRFKEETIQQLLEEQWWRRSLQDLLPELESFQTPLEGDAQVR